MFDSLFRKLARKTQALRRPRSCRLSLETLEDRTLPATITWTGLAGDNIFESAKNWDLNRAPAPTDQVVINTTGITITQTANESVLSIQSQASFAVTGGSLTVTSGSSAMNAAFTVGSGYSLTATGLGTSFTASGGTIIDAANLYATGGASLSLPGLASYTGHPKGNNTYLEATGTGSVLDLPDLVTFTGGQSYYGGGVAALIAQQGGLVKLGSCTTDGGGLIDVEATGGSSVLLNKLTGLNTATLTLDATSTIAAASLASFTSGILTVTGGTPNFPSLADIDESSIYVNGGNLTLPAVSSYTGNPKGLYTYLQASGTGSVLDLPNLVTFTGGQSYYGGGVTYLVGQQGGVVRLTGWTTDGGGLIGITATTGGSVLMNKLASLDSAYVRLDGTGSTSVSQLTTLTNGSLTITGGSLSFTNLTTFTGSTLNLNGGSPSFPALAHIDQATLYVNAGSLSLPSVTSYTGHPKGNNTYLEATGTGSVLDLPDLVTFTGGQSYYGGGVAALIAQQGGLVKLGSCTTDGGGLIDVEATGGSSVLLNKLTGLNTATLTLDATSTIAAASLASFTSGILTVTGGTPNFPSLADIDESSIYVNGGTLSLPAVTSYTGNPKGLYTYLQASGTGSVFSLPNLVTFTGGQSYYGGGYSYVLAQQGGEVDLPSVTTNGGGLFEMTVGNGGTLNLAKAVVSFPTSSTAGTINLPVVPQSLAMIVYLVNSTTFSGGTTFNVPSGDSIALSGGTYTGGVTFHVSPGATADLAGGATTTYSGTLTASGGGSVTFSSGTVSAGLGGMTLNMIGTTFQWTGGSMQLSVGDVINLGTINLAGSNLKQIDADGTFDDYGSIIETGTGYLGVHGDNITPTTLRIEPGGQYLLESDAGVNNPFAGAARIDNAGTIIKTAGSGTSALTFNGVFNNTGTIEADSGVLSLNPTSFSQLSGSTLTGGTWTAVQGASLQFPSSTVITTNAANLTLSGTGASIVGLSGLAANSGSFTLTAAATFTTAADFSNSGSLTVGAGSKLTVAGNYTQSSVGTLTIHMGGTPASGAFGQLAISKSATLAGSFTASLINGFAPSAGQDFAVLKFASATGTFTRFTGLSPFFTESQSATSLDLVDASVNGVDLVAASVTAPVTARTGQPIVVQWQVNNPGSQAAGSWQDSVYLSATPQITSSSTLLGAVPRNGGLAAGSSYSGSWSGAVPAVPPGTYYVLVQVDSLYQVPDANRANNTQTASTGPLTVSVPVLTLGTSFSDTFPAANQDRYYQVTVPAGGTLTVTLQSVASSGAVALYLSQGALPTPFNYQVGAAIPNQPSQTATVPQVLTAATYYILAHSISGAAATSGFSLTATQTSAITVSAITPPSGGTSGNVTVEIDGTNFTPNATASLTLGSTTIPATAISFVNSSRLYATFNLTGAAAGKYTLSVQQGAQSVTAPTPFQVVAANPGPLNLTLSVPQFVRAGRTGSLVIGYTNTTANDIVAPFLDLTSTNPNVLFSTPDDPNNFVQDAVFLAVAPNGPAGVLRPGQSGQLTITLLSNDTMNGDQIPVRLGEIKPGQPIDWAARKALLQPSIVPTAAWNVIFNNILATIGSTTDSFNAALAQVATYLGSLGETPTAVSNVYRLWSFLVAQASASFPVRTLTAAVDASLSTPGSLMLAIDRTFQSSIFGRYQAGLFGLGWASVWQTALKGDSSGNVTLQSGTAFGLFVHQANGSYLDVDGVYGTLTSSAGHYALTTKTGIQYVFLTNGLLSYVQDPDGNRITLSYNAQNQLTTLTYANPGVASQPAEQLTLSYNSQGFVSQVADGTGATWAYLYDGAGHLLSVTAPGNRTTAYTYDTGSNPETVHALLSMTKPDGGQQDFTYDGQGRLSSIGRNGGADPITLAYPGQGEVTATDAAHDQYTIWFNELGLPSRVMDPRIGVSSYCYDLNGNLAGVTDAAGNTYQGIYDGNGNLTQIINPLGQSVHATYGPLSNLTSVTDAAGNRTAYGYDATGNLLRITYPGGGQQSFRYDPLGNPVQVVLPNGDPISCQYNAQGLVTQESFADGTSLAFSYDPHGNLLTAKTYNASGTLTGTTTLTYNAANELLSVTYPNGQFLHFTYNPATGQRTQSIDQDGFTVNYSYDALGRLSQLQDGSGNRIDQYTYNNQGQLATKLNGNGTSTLYSYDAAGNRTSVINYAPDGKTVNSSFTYTYNLLGQMISMTDAAGNKTTYGYDAIGQLTQVGLPGGQTITYVYNAAGDRTQVLTNGTPTTYASNADNEITQAGSTVFTYDPNGNLHTMTDASGTTTYTYNDLNQLVSITAADGTTTTFQYSPLGFRVGTSVNGTPSNYLVDPTGLGNVDASYNGSGSPSAHFVWGLGLVSQTSPGGTGYYDFDASHNTAGITGTNGSYVNRYSYLPFGETTTSLAGLPNPFTFVGQLGVMADGGSLFSMRLRDYSAGTGQFLSTDPLGLNGGDTNRRRYVKNNPVTGADPFGLGPQIGGIQLPYAVPGGIAIPGSIYFPLAGAIVGGVLGSFLSGPGFGTIAGAIVGAGLFWDLYSNANGFAGLTIPYIIIPFSNLASSDPNALVGPAGYSAQGFIQPGGTWSYGVEFENDGSLAAQDVTVSEQLDANLDWSTLQLGSFGFGPIKVAIPAGLTEYQTTVTYQNIDGTPLNVDVAIAFNVQTGLLTATFTSLDPSTGETPTGLLDGFLYPDNKNGVGEGYVQYTIHPKAGLTTGAAVHQQAAVVFDINSPLTTAPAVNTIDSGPPTSSVTALPPTESTTFTVSWTGQDDSGGSGITFYDLYVSDNGGPFTLWLGQTTQTSASFTGMVGHAFGFYSVATDHVGNRQPTPPAAQATTTVGTATLMATAPTGPFLATEGQTSAVQNLATFTDGGGAGSLSDYAVSVDWGDGNGFTSDPSVTISGPVNGVFTISGSHRYGEEDGFTGMIKLKVVHGGTTSNTVSMGVQVTDPPVVATKLAVSTTAGGPFNGAMATFTDLAGAEAPDGTHYTATIAWGDNTPTTAGTITLANGTFTVSGTHAYAAAGSYTMTMTINHEATSTPVQITVGVASLGQFVPTGWTKPISFWAGLQGQSLLHRFGLTSAGQSLGQWLAMAFPNLYGGQNGAPNLSPFSNAQISSYFQSLFLASKGVGLDAEVLATALEVFTTTTSLGGSVGQSYGFTVTDNGLGAYSWNIGISGQAFGVPNNTILNVYQILLAANNAAASGEPWGTNSFLRNEAFSVLHGVNGGYSQPSSSVQRWNAGRTPRQKSLILVPHGAQ